MERTESPPGEHLTVEFADGRTDDEVVRHLADAFESFRSAARLVFQSGAFTFQSDEEDQQ